MDENNLDDEMKSVSNSDGNTISCLNGDTNDDDEMIVDVHQDVKSKHGGLFGWYDFVQTQEAIDGGDDPDSSLPPIGRSRLLYSKLSKKPTRPAIKPKTKTQNSTTQSQPQPQPQKPTPPPPPQPSTPPATIIIDELPPSPSSLSSSSSIIDLTTSNVELSEIETSELIPTISELPVLNRETAIDSLLNYYSKFFSVVPNFGVSDMEKQFLKVFFEYLLDKSTENFPSPVPMLRSVPLDFYHLYSRVLEKGGFSHMSTGDWEIVFKKIRNYDSLMQNSEEMLKSLYVKYLKSFESFISRQDNRVEFNNPILEYIQKQNMEEFQSMAYHLRRKIVAVVRKNSRMDVVKATKSGANIDSSAVVSRLPIPEVPEVPDVPEVPELPKKLTKTILSQLHKSKKRAYLSFISKKGRTINLKIDVYDTPLGLAIMKKEPIVGVAQVYGQLIYSTFDAAQISRDETIRKEYKLMGANVIDPGSLCYWMGGSSILFGYGPTPKSKKQECKLTENCVVFGKLNDPNYTFEVSDSNSSLYLPSILHDIETDAPEEWTVKLSSHPPISEEPVPLKKRARAFVSESPRKKVDSTPSSSSSSSSSSPVNTNVIQIDLSPKKTTAIVPEPTTPTKESTKESNKSDTPKDVTTPTRLESPKDATTPNIDYISDSRKYLTLRYRYNGEEEKDCKLATTHFVAREYIDYSTVISLLRRNNVDTQSVSEIRYYKDDACGWQILPNTFKFKLVSSQTVIQVLLFNTK